MTTLSKQPPLTWIHEWCIVHVRPVVGDMTKIWYCLHTTVAKSEVSSGIRLHCISCPLVEETPKTIFSPWNVILPGEPHQKTRILPLGTWVLLGDSPYNVIGLLWLFLSSNWVGFVVKTWQTCCTHIPVDWTRNMHMFMMPEENRPPDWAWFLPRFFPLHVCHWWSFCFVPLFWSFGLLSWEHLISVNIVDLIAQILFNLK